MDHKLEGLLGLARRAGKLTFGSDAVIKDAAGGKAQLVILTNDAAQRTLNNIKNTCRQYGVKVLTVPVSKNELGHAIGRGETAVAAITDSSFAQGIAGACRLSIREEDCEYDD